MTQYDDITIVVEYLDGDKFPPRQNFVIYDDHRIIKIVCSDKRTFSCRLPRGVWQVPSNHVIVGDWKEQRNHKSLFSLCR